MPNLQLLVDLGYLRKLPEPPVPGSYIAATAFSELGVIDPNSYPQFIPSGGSADPERIHPDLLP
jgi:hypothetical protein